MAVGRGPFLGVKARRENSDGVPGCELEPKRARDHFEGGPSDGLEGPSVDREVLDEEWEMFEVSSAPEEVTS